MLVKQHNAFLDRPSIQAESKAKLIPHCILNMDIMLITEGNKKQTKGHHYELINVISILKYYSYIMRLCFA